MIFFHIHRDNVGYIILIATHCINNTRDKNGAKHKGNTYADGCVGSDKDTICFPSLQRSIRKISCAHFHSITQTKFFWKIMEFGSNPCPITSIWSSKFRIFELKTQKQPISINVNLESGFKCSKVSINKIKHIQP